MTTESFQQLQREDVTLSDRMAYIDFKLRFTGSVNRSDLRKMFGLAEAAASKMMTKYSELRPENMSYNRSLRANAILRETFVPLIDIDAETALGMLANGFNKNKLTNDPMVPYARIGQPNNHLDIEDVSKITRAIAGGYSINTRYLSDNSQEKNEREVFPLAIFFDGKTWRFRGLCKKNHNNGEFKNFNFSRAKETIENLTKLRKPYEELTQDKMWNNQVPLLLVPHPDRSLVEKERIKLDYGFTDDHKLIVTERAALVLILINQWNIDNRTDKEKNIDKQNKKDKYYNFELTNRDMVQVVMENLNNRD